MEILEPNLVPLSAFETLELVREMQAAEEQAGAEREQEQAQATQTDQPPPLASLPNNNLEQLVHNLVAYFEDPNNHLPQPKQTAQSVLSLCESLRTRFGQVSGRRNGLTKAERLQICDLAPTELVEIYLIIEECDARFTEDEIQEIILLVKQNLSSDRRTTASLRKPSHALNGSNLPPLDPLDFECEPDPAFNLGDIDDDDALVAEAREGVPPPDQELDEVPD